VRVAVRVRVLGDVHEYEYLYEHEVRYRSKATAIS
jgi:hypothetical protein